MSVGDLVEMTRAGQANVSKQLQLLLRAGLVARRKEGLRVYYSIVDPSVFDICEVVCGSLSSQLKRELHALQGGTGMPRTSSRPRRQG